MSLKLNFREQDTVLAALRYWQQRTRHPDDCPLFDIACEHGVPLDPDEIDQLCERINNNA